MDKWNDMTRIAELYIEGRLAETTYYIYWIFFCKEVRPRCRHGIGRWKDKKSRWQECPQCEGPLIVRNEAADSLTTISLRRITLTFLLDRSLTSNEHSFA